MAVSPKEAAGPTRQDIETADAMERELDRLLSRQYTDGKTVEVKLNDLEDVDTDDVTPKVIVEIVRRYREVGWTVEHFDDQEGGPGIFHFSADKTDKPVRAK